MAVEFEKLKQGLEDRARALETQQCRALLNSGRSSSPRGASDRSYLALLRMMTGLDAGAFFSVSAATCATGVALSALAYSELHWIFIYLFLLPAMAGPIMLVVVAAYYLAFRNWPAKLAFECTGDFSILARDRSDSSRWRRCTVRVRLTDGGPAQVEAVRASLRIFAALANKSMYVTRWGVIERWQVDGLTARGEANARVAFKLYRFITGD